MRIVKGPWCYATSLLLASGFAGCGASSHALDPSHPRAVGCEGCVVLTDANVFDGTVGGPGTVVLRGERVEEVQRGAVRVVAGEVRSLPGRTILPGLIDAHVHVLSGAAPPAAGAMGMDAEAHLKALLRAGVTTIVDLGTERHVVFGLRERIRSGAMLGPDLLAAGPGLTPSGGHPCTTGRPPFDQCALVDTPDEARDVVEGLARDEADLIKVVIESGSDARPLPEFDGEVLARVQQVAAEHALQVAVHVSDAADVSKALDAGVRWFAHLPVRDKLSPSLIARLVATGAVVIPTIAVVDVRVRASRGVLDEVRETGADEDIAAEIVAAWKDEALVSGLGTAEAKAEYEARRAQAMANLRACHEAGVRIAAGTDSGNPGTFHGLSMRRELSLYVEAGMSPREALVSATRDAAGVLGLADRGRIEAGALANLLVVRGDPEQDIGALGQVDAVYLRGRALELAALSLRAKVGLSKEAVRGLGAGATCIQPSECADGLVCTGQWWCRRSCGEGVSCSEGEACFAQDTLTNANYCHPGEGCNPLSQDCPNATACVWLGGGVTRCWYPGRGVAGEACSSWGMCASGHQCDAAAGTCVRLCDPGGQGAGCSAGTTCVDRSGEAGLPVGECR